MQVVVVAERLRRQTRNLLGSPRAGSNPADYDKSFVSLQTLLPILHNEKHVAEK